MSVEVLVGLLGGAAVATFVIGLWVPAFSRHRAIQTRVEQFALAGTPRGLAMDLGGRRRGRTLRRPGGREASSAIVREIERRVALAGVEATAGEVLSAMGLCALAGLLLVAVLTGKIVAGFVVVIPAAYLPIMYLNWRGGRRMQAFREQLPDTLALLASAIRTGHGMLQSFEQVGRQPPEPMQSAFAQVVREIGLGASQEEALDRLAVRFPSEDMDLLVTSIKVHQQTGGSLSRILSIIQHTIQERVRIEGDIRSLTSQQRYSAYILSLLPVFLVIALFLVGGDYMTPMLTDLGLQIALGIAAIMVLAGFLIMKKIAEIDV